MQNSELMAGSQYLQTTRSLLYTGLPLILNYNYFCSVDTKHHIHRRWINSFPQLLASLDLKTNLVLIKFNSRPSGKLKFVKLKNYRSLPRPFLVLESGENNVLISSGKAGHVVPTPFLVLVDCSVTIVAAQSLQLGVVSDNF